MNFQHLVTIARTQLRGLTRLTLIAILTLSALMLSPLCRAQLSTAGTITGSINDSTGAVIPGAQVTITDVDTNVKTLVLSNSAGVYTQVGLPHGH